MQTVPALTVILVVAVAAGGYVNWQQGKALRVPPGLARANGRIEVVRVDVATRHPGRLAEVRVEEGATVAKGETVALLDTTESMAQLAAAKAAVHRAHQSVARARAEVAVKEAELRLTETELGRVVELMRTNTATQSEVDRRTALRDVSRSARDGAQAAVEDAKAATEVAEAEVAQIEAAIADMTLKAPVSGRVEYRLAQAGEVVAAGGRVLTLLNLNDAHMTIFLPTGQAGRVELGSEARIVLDSMPGYVVPARVSFVAAEAQFTPKYVETANEREKLMYRVKLHIAPNVLKVYSGFVKAGMTGDAYVTTQRDAIWPANLSARLPDVQ